MYNFHFVEKNNSLTFDLYFRAMPSVEALRLIANKKMHEAKKADPKDDTWDREVWETIDNKLAVFRRFKEGTENLDSAMTMSITKFTFED